jgi:plasmid stabilization system protein ParE
MAVEQPAFDLLNQDGDIEIRQYRPLIVAETSIEGHLDSASSSGFKRIADYIFGNNTPAQAGAAKEKIAMTAPVTMEPQEGLTGIATHAARWRMQFVMPHVYTMATLPRPNNPEVTLREVPAKRYAVLRFSGLVGERKAQRKCRQLADWLKTKSLNSVARAQLARYDPPWTLPFLRRNEIMMEISQPTQG